jgi:hypothetical protein
MLPLGGRHVFGSLPFWLGIVYVTFPMGLLLYGWNDYVDFEVDRVNPRKGSFLFGARRLHGAITPVALEYCFDASALRGRILRIARDPHDVVFCGNGSGGCRL